MCSHVSHDVQLRGSTVGVWEGWSSHHSHMMERQSKLCVSGQGATFGLGYSLVGECLSLNTYLGSRCVNLVQSLASLFDLITFLNYRFLFTNIICMCIMCVSGAYRDQKKSLNPLDLILQSVVGCHVGAGN